jgi:WD40 repeat protein/TPR repeat protein
MRNPQAVSQQLAKPPLRDYSQAATLQKTLTEHNGTIYCLTVLPDGRLASGSVDKTIKLWDVKTGQCLHTLTGHSSSVYALTVLPDGRLVSGSLDNTIKLWDASNGKCLHTLEGHSSSVYALTSLPDGRLASGSNDNTIKLWDASSGKCLHTLTGHSDFVMALTVLPDGWLASGSKDKTIKLWDTQKGQCLYTLTGHSDFVMALTVLPDGWLASGSKDKTIKLWDAKTGKCLHTLTGHSDRVNALTVLPDGWLASSSWDNTIKVWDTSSRKCLHNLTGHSNWVNALTVLPDGWLASGSKDKTIKLWEFPMLQPLLQSSQQKTSVAVPPSPSKLAPRLVSPAASASVSVELTALLDKANGYYEEGNYSEALKGYRKAAIRGDVTAEKRVKSLEELLAKMKNDSSAVLERPSVEKQSSEKEEKMAPEKNFKNGEKYFAKKDYEKAKKYYKRAVKENHVGAKAKLKECERLISSFANSQHIPPATPLTPPAPTGSPASERLVDGLGKINISIAIAYQDLSVGKELGKGTYGIVYQGEHNYTAVAIKKLINQELKAASLEEFKREVSIMATLRNPYVVILYGACFDKPHYAIVMEYLPKGSLFDVLQSEEELTWSLRYHMGLDIAYGMAYLHKQGIIHADLKSLNVLLDKDYRAKISDFGMSKVKSSSSAATLMGAASGGSTRWMAPELFNDEDEAAKSTKASDVYSYGIVLWELGARKIPFEKKRNEAVSHLVVTGKREAVTPDTPPSMAKLIGRCWEQRAEQRPTMDEAVKVLRENQGEMTAVTTTSSHTATGSRTGYQDNLASQANISQQADNRSTYRPNLGTS